MGEPFVGRVLNRLMLLTPRLKLDMWLHLKLQRKLYDLRNSFLIFMHVIQSADQPITLYCDNSGAVAQSKESRSHKKQKHILRKYHLIRDFIDRVHAVVTKIASEENLVDPFTKSLPELFLRNM